MGGARDEHETGLMRATLGALVAFALGGAAVAQAPKAKIATPSPPTVPSMAQAGWAYVVSSVTANVYMKPFAKGADFPWSKAWVRYEAKAGRVLVSGERSAITLEEYRCNDGQSRILQSTGYPQNSLGGRPGLTEGVGPWSYVSPDTVESAVFEWACEPSVDAAK